MQSVVLTLSFVLLFHSRLHLLLFTYILSVVLLSASLLFSTDPPLCGSLSSPLIYLSALPASFCFAALFVAAVITAGVCVSVCEDGVIESVSE